MKRWDICEDVVHYPDGGWFGKLRWSDKEAEAFLSKVKMLSLYKDEKGYYNIIGELVWSID